MQQPSDQLARDILGMMQPYPHAPLPPPYHRMSHAELRAHVAELDAARDRAKAEAEATARAEAKARRAAARSPTPQVPSLPAAADPLPSGAAPPTPAQLRHAAEEVLMEIMRDEGEDVEGDREDSKRASLRLRAAIATLSYLDRRERAAERAADRALKRRGKGDSVSHFAASENEQVSADSKACPAEASRKNHPDGEPSVARDAEAPPSDIAPPAPADGAVKGRAAAETVEDLAPGVAERRAPRPAPPPAELLQARARSNETMSAFADGEACLPDAATIVKSSKNNDLRPARDSA